VLTAPNGLEALDKARKILPDLIVLDVIFPALGGLSVCDICAADRETRGCRSSFARTFLGRLCEFRDSRLVPMNSCRSHSGWVIFCSAWKDTCSWCARPLTLWKAALIWWGAGYKPRRLSLNYARRWPPLMRGMLAA